MNDNTIQNIDHYVQKFSQSDYIKVKEVENLIAIRHTQTTTFEGNVYEPIVCLILQGAKEIGMNGHVAQFTAGQALIVSHDTLVTARVTEASVDKPFISLVLSIDLALLREIHLEMGEQHDLSGLDHQKAGSLEIAQADEKLADAICRYFDMSQDPLEASIMAPIVMKEIHFRLLTARHGGMLRQLLNRDSHASRIYKAIGKIRESFSQTLVVAELAKSVGMSASSFHEHFKTVAGTTPLQYQKELRLLEARKILANGDISVSQTAFDVGYESATQFSREYARKFNVSPREDVGRELMAV